MYESEKKEGDSHNKLLKQIQTGVRLKKVKCNDRSKPNLDGKYSGLCGHTLHEFT